MLVENCGTIYPPFFIPIFFGKKPVEKSRFSPPRISWLVATNCELLARNKSYKNILETWKDISDVAIAEKRRQLHTQELQTAGKATIQKGSQLFFLTQKLTRLEKGRVGMKVKACLSTE